MSDPEPACPMPAERRISIDDLNRNAAAWALIDIREPAECSDGVIAGSVNVPLSLGESAIRTAIEDSAVLPPLLICASGKRCDRLLALPGFEQVTVLEGGVVSWRAAGLPLTAMACVIPASDERYLRHHMLPQVGRAGQERLSRARVTLIGAGGLGSPVAFYLAAAGVGTITLIDQDRIDRSNLQRQILHTDERVGSLKVESARQTLLALNPDITVHARAERLVAANAEELLRGADLIIDGADNFETRYLVNDTAMRLGIPWIYGAVQAFAGQVSMFAPHLGADQPCYRCLFPEPPAPGEAPNCAEAGVLGALPGLIGSLQATEALKWLLGLDEPLLGKLLCVDALRMDFRSIRLGRDPACPHSCPPLSECRS